MFSVEAVDIPENPLFYDGFPAVFGAINPLSTRNKRSAVPGKLQNLWPPSAHCIEVKIEVLFQPVGYSCLTGKRQTAFCYLFQRSGCIEKIGHCASFANSFSA